MGFHHPLLLYGLAAVLVPPLARAVSRWRSDEVDWGATQFLRRPDRGRLREWLGVVWQTAAIGLLVTAAAGPVVRYSAEGAAGGPPRTTILLIDGSAGMAVRHGGRTAADAATAAARGFLTDLGPGDRVAVYEVRHEATNLLAVPAADPAAARSALDLLPPPRGPADWPAALESVAAIAPPLPGEVEVVVLTDARLAAWADADALRRWDRLARRPLPPVRVVKVAADRPVELPNAALGPLSFDPTPPGPDGLRFRGTIRRTPGLPLPRAWLDVDGRPAGEVVVAPNSADLVPVTFTRRFAPGTHLVTLRLDPDAIPGDDRADLALTITAGPPGVPDAAAVVADLAPGQPFTIRPRDDEPPGTVTVTGPDGSPSVHPVRSWPLAFDRTHVPGPYRYATVGGRVGWFVVRPDPKDFDLTPMTAADWRRVSDRVPAIEFVGPPEKLRERRSGNVREVELRWPLVAVAAGLGALGWWFSRRRAPNWPGV